MDNIQIFKDEAFKNTDQKEQYQYLGALSVILASAMNSEDKSSAWELLREASILGHPYGSDVFNVLYAAAAMEVTRNHVNIKKANSLMDYIKKFMEGLKNE